MKEVNTSTRSKPAFHQIYRNCRGTDFVECRQVSTSELVDMALSAEVVQISQDWPKKLSQAEIDRFRAPFNEVMLYGDPILDDPEGAGPLVRCKFEWDVHGLREEFRHEHDRHVLAGRGTYLFDGSRRSLLLLVLTPTDIGSCEWQLSN